MFSKTAVPALHWFQCVRRIRRSIYLLGLPTNAGCDTRLFLRGKFHTHTYVYGPKTTTSQFPRPLSSWHRYYTYPTSLNCNVSDTVTGLEPPGLKAFSPLKWEQFTSGQERTPVGKYEQVMYGCGTTCNRWTDFKFQFTLSPTFRNDNTIRRFHTRNIRHSLTGQLSVTVGWDL